jgi:predicted metal-dependent peptidase
MTDEVESENNPFDVAPLTDKQKQQWGDTTSMMAWTAPGFRHIWYKLLSKSDSQHVAVMSKRVPIAATDGQNVICNPDTFFDLGLPERVFAMAHEIVHNVYGDVELLHRCSVSEKVPMTDGTTLPFDNETMQHAMDYRINALLVDSKIGKLIKDSQLGKQKISCLYDLKMAGPNDSVLDVYKKVYKKKKEDGTLGAGGFDIVLPPGKSTGQNPGTAAASRSQSQWAIEVSTAQTLEQVRSQGKLAGSLQRMFKEILEPEVPWTEHLRGIFNRRIGSGSYDWRRADRRFIVRDLWMPSRSGHGAGHIVVWGDTSGSIGSGEL